MFVKPILLALMCLTLLIVVPATAADDSQATDDEAKACELMDELEALERAVPVPSTVWRSGIATTAARSAD